ncbi:ATP-dependent acyl-CoA ligase [Amycolatopsis deserti]|uniref:ATP-dependent acyl-CoA ligase n=1 Tax=Amycolatopsis deserti TaxID=185696 RepID=A0ABQ3IQ25_9PSEU|nr:AMP-binding protein [Amycolatopsis deserti]GHE88881.1 ATP-dependent acyl-CoA ligase [Amycolatopsis deserti]
MTLPDSLFAALRRSAAETPDTEFLRVSGQVFTYREALDRVEATARGLRALGVEPGDRVGIMAGNCPEAVWAWLGANAARAIDVPFNAEVRGRLLDYLVKDAAPRVLIGSPDHLAAVAATSDYDPEVVVPIGERGPDGARPRSRQVPFGELLELGRSSGGDLEPPGPNEIATIMYTSGTTGPSKGVMLPQRYYPGQAGHGDNLFGFRPDDVYYLVQPLFHIDARSYVSACLCFGGVVALGERFSVRDFWNEVREHGATIFGTIGTMLWLLYKQQPRPDDADLPARIAVCSSTPREIMLDFEKRFGIKIVESYGMTECLLITAVPPEETRLGSIGKPVAEIEVRVVDDHDVQVSAGEVGELVYRPCDHFSMMQGYWNKPEETVEAWRNLWFHTGDLVRQDEEGWIEYIGRKKDSIRRRGENVSAWEVEQAAAAHPDVLEVAAIGVPSEVGEEDVAVLVVVAPGADLEPGDLVEFLGEDLPRFAVPRYVEFVDRLPKTPSERIEKRKVRERGITAAAWDANVALGRR